MARRMLLMKQSSFLCCLTLTTLASSISNYCTHHFEFPNLKDSQRIISYGYKNIRVDFRVNSTCSTPYSSAYLVLDKTNTFCTFYSLNGTCQKYTTNDYCHCPEDGSDLYRVEIPADKSNTTLTWKSKPFNITEHKIHIVFVGDGIAPDRTEGSTSNTPATNIMHMQISTPKNIDTRDSKATDSNTTGATVATCITIITAVIVTIALLVKKYKIKVTIRRRLAPHDLALQEIQDRNQQPALPPPAQPQQQQQQQQRRLPEIPGQYQVPSSVPARSGLDASRSVGRVSHVYEVVGGDQEGEVPKVLKTELPETNLHPRPPAQEMTAAAQASKPSIGNGLYFHIHPNE